MSATARIPDIQTCLLVLIFGCLPCLPETVLPDAVGPSCAFAQHLCPTQGRGAGRGGGRQGRGQERWSQRVEETGGERQREVRAAITKAASKCQTSSICNITVRIISL